MMLLVWLALQTTSEPVPQTRPTLSPLFGAWLRTVGDVNLDGHADFVVGDEGWTSSGSPAAFWVLSGKSGTEIASFHAEDGAAQFPARIGRADDRDADGAADLWLELPDRRVVLWSGKSRKITRDASESERERAFEVAYVGDFDGDGAADRLGFAEGRSLLFSGRDGSTLWKCDFAFERVLVLGGGARGKPMVLCVDSPSRIAQGHVQLRDGSDGVETWTARDDDYWYFGAAIDVLDDINGDGVNDWIVGGWNGRSHWHGRMQMRSGADGNVLMEFERRERAAFRVK